MISSSYVINGITKKSNEINLVKCFTIDRRGQMTFGHKNKNEKNGLMKIVSLKSNDRRI